MVGTREATISAGKLKCVDKEDDYYLHTSDGLWDHVVWGEGILTGYKVETSGIYEEVNPASLCLPDRLSIIQVPAKCCCGEGSVLLYIYIYSYIIEQEDVA